MDRTVALTIELPRSRPMAIDEPLSEGQSMVGPQGRIVPTYILISIYSNKLSRLRTLILLNLLRLLESRAERQRGRRECTCRKTGATGACACIRRCTQARRRSRRRGNIPVAFDVAFDGRLPSSRKRESAL